MTEPRVAPEASALDPSPQASTKPTALAYALGSLTERILVLTEEQARSRLSMEALPTKVELLLNPRILSLETSFKVHDGRIRALERDKWKVVGGGAVLLLIGGLLAGHTLH